MNHLFLLVSVLAAGVVIDGGRLSANEPEPNAAGYAVPHLKTVDSTPIVYIEQAVSYWRLGTLLTQLAEYMDHHELTGPAFVRYLEDKARAPGGVVRCQVGCVVDGNHRAVPPFQLATRPSETVASLTTRGLRNRVEIDRWIRENGHAPSGILIELLRAEPRRPGTLPGLELYEVQVPIIEKGAAVESAEFKSATKDHPEPVIETAPSSKAAGVPESPEIIVVYEVPAAKTKEGPSRASAEVGAAIDNLIVQEQFADLAERIIPIGHSKDPGLLAWLAQVSVRVSAAARGIEKMYPDQSAKLGPIAEALDRRAKVVCGKLAAQTDWTGGRLASEAEPADAPKHKIIRELDLLLGRIAVRRAGPEEALATVVRVIKEVAEFLVDGK